MMRLGVHRLATGCVVILTFTSLQSVVESDDARSGDCDVRPAQSITVEDGVVALALSPDRKHVGLGRYMPYVSLRRSGDLRQRVVDDAFVPDVLTYVTFVTYLPNGRQLIAGGNHGVVRLYDAQDISLVRSLNDEDDMFVQTARISPDGRLFATADKVGNRLRMRRIEDGTELWRADIEGVLDANFADDGELVYSTGPDLSAWSVESGERRHTLTTMPTGMTAISEDGRFLAAAHADDTIIDRELLNRGAKEVDPSGFMVVVWDTASKEQVARFQQEGTASPAVALALVEVDKELILLAGYRNGAVMIADAKSGKAEVMPDAHQGVVSSIAVDAENDRLFTAGFNADDAALDKLNLKQWKLSDWIACLK